MKNKGTVKAFLAAVCAALTLSACGNTDTESSSATADTFRDNSTAAPSDDSGTGSSQADDTAQSSQEDTAQDSSSPEESETEDVSQTDESSQTEQENTVEDVSELYGDYIEQIDGEELNYVIAADPVGYIIPIGEYSGSPMDISVSDEGIVVNRGVSDDFTPVPYSYKDGVLEYSVNGHQYRWVRQEFIPVVGDYNMVDEEGTILEKWTFGSGEGVRSVNGAEEAFTFSQTADKFSITLGGTAAEYDYSNDIFRLNLTSSDGTVQVFAAAKG